MRTRSPTREFAARTRPRLIAALAPLALLAACAHDRADYRNFTLSEPGMPGSQAYVTRYADQNRDGKVTRDEAKVDPALAQSFDPYDRNRDGVLDHATSDTRDTRQQDKERGLYGDRDPLD